MFLFPNFIKFMVLGSHTPTLHRFGEIWHGGVDLPNLTPKSATCCPAGENKHKIDP